MCGCNDLTCAGKCPCGCTHTLKEHDIAFEKKIREQIAKDIEATRETVLSEAKSFGVDSYIVAESIVTVCAAFARGQQ